VRTLTTLAWSSTLCAGVIRRSAGRVRARSSVSAGQSVGPDGFESRRPLHRSVAAQRVWPATANNGPVILPSPGHHLSVKIPPESARAAAHLTRSEHVMNGSPAAAGQGVWQLRVYHGTDAATGRRRWATTTVHGNCRYAERQLAQFAAEAGYARLRTGSVGDLLDRWAATVSPGWAASTVRETRSIIECHLRPPRPTVGGEADHRGHRRLLRTPAPRWGTERSSATSPGACRHRCDVPHCAHGRERAVARTSPAPPHPLDSQFQLL
jgi:hypothetical protein